MKTSAVNNKGEIFTNKEKEFEKLLTEYNTTRSVETVLQSLVNITHNSEFDARDFTPKSCEQFKLLLEDWQKNDMIVFKENSQNPPNNSTISYIEFIDYMWKLKRLADDETVEYQDWTTAVRSIAYSTATGISIGMIFADIFGCLGKYREFFPHVNFITANFVTVVFQNYYYNLANVILWAIYFVSASIS